MANIREILSMSPTERKIAYGVSGTYTDDDGKLVERRIDRIVIDGNVFTDYSAFSFIWEKSYVKSPVRSADGTIGNLNSYATFVTPHLTIDFGLLSIDSYRKLMRLLYEKNEFTVTCYDIVYNKTTTNKMYFATEEMPKLWTLARAIDGGTDIQLLGIIDYKLELIGTNSSLDVVEILYYDENGNLIADATQSATKGDWVTINYNYITIDPSFKFDNYWVDEADTIYNNGETINVYNTIKLHPSVIDTNEYTLSFDYGNGNPVYNYGQTYIYMRILNGTNIFYEVAADGCITDIDLMHGTGSKTVQYDGESYQPYEFKGWYWSTVEEPSALITRDSTYDYRRNMTMHQIYAPKVYHINPVTNTHEILWISSLYVPYGEKANVPNLNVSGKKFEGWYLDAAFTKKFDGIMPPKDITIYAKWG